MKCPKCREDDMEILVVEPPETHLTVGRDILWCPNCGTTASCFSLTEGSKLHGIKSPKVLRYKLVGGIV